MSSLDQLCILLELPVTRKILLITKYALSSIFSPSTIPPRPGPLQDRTLSAPQLNASATHLYFSCVSLMIFFNSSTRSAVSFRTITSSTVSTTSPFSPRFLLRNNKRKPKQFRPASDSYYPWNTSFFFLNNSTEYFVLANLVLETIQHSHKLKLLLNTLPLIKFDMKTQKHPTWS